MAQTKKAVLAGGCFWGLEELIRSQPGVLDTECGYCGGKVENPTYRNHEGHAEALEITYDPGKTSFRNLLNFFFQIHNPTTMNRQGNDIGTSYRSAIFYADEAQRETAATRIAAMEASGKWPGKIVTELVPLTTFYPAESYHQDYLQHHPRGYTCHFVRPEWQLPEMTPPQG